MSNYKQFNYIKNKHIHIASSLFSDYFIKENRKNDIITTFFRPNSTKKRINLLETIENKMVSHKNFTQVWGTKLKELYKSSKILINIH